MVEVGERIAIIGENGAGKTTFLRCLQGDLTPDSGDVKWSEGGKIAYYAQDHASDFEKDMNLFDWMSQWRRENDDEQSIRGFVGPMLFSSDDIKKSVKVLSGGEQRRMLFGKMMMALPNILLMDEPTNHMDMESIESLNMALEQYGGTLMFVSHDRQFVSSLATRVIEIKKDKIIDFKGTYEEYLASQGVEA
jgi:ATPase subunit of ABC transporter with duplicated ATPase domains